jgi:iron complex outermembrane recepter protein
MCGGVDLSASNLTLHGGCKNYLMRSPMNHPLQSRLSLATAFLACFLVTSPAHAQQQINIDPVLVTLDRFEEKSSRAPLGMEIITANQIEVAGHQSLPEFLSSHSGISLVNNFFGNGSQSAAIDIRGYGAVGDENTLVLLNGVRIKNNDLSSVNWSSIPLDSIDRIEIVKGSGGVLYGAGATAGYINVITKRQKPNERTANVRTDLGSFGTRSMDISGATSGDNAGLWIFGQRYNSDNYRENNEERRSVVKLDYQWFGDVNTLTFSAGADRQDLRTPGDLRINPGGGTPISSIDRQSSDSKNDFSTLDGNNVTLSLKQDMGRWTIIEEISFRDSDSSLFSEVDDEFSNIETTVWQLSPRAKYDAADLLMGSEFIFGLDYFKWDRTHTRATTPSTILTQPFGVADLDQTNLGIYGRGTFGVTEQLTAVLGFRHEQQDGEANDAVNAAAPTPFGTTNNAAAPKSQTLKNNAYDLGATYSMESGVDIDVSTSRAFRVANSDEVFDNGFNGQTFENDRTFVFLEPQVSYTHEIGVSLACKQAFVSASVFQTDTRNEIRLDPVEFVNTNYSVTQRRGIELQTTWRDERWLVRCNFSYIQPKFLNGERDGVSLVNKDIPLVPRNKIGLSADLALYNNYTAGAKLNYTSDQFMTNDEINSFGRKIPSYSVLDLNIRKNVGPWTLALNVNNALGREYFTFAVNSTTTGSDAFNFYPLPERSVFITAGYAFGQ